VDRFTGRTTKKSVASATPLDPYKVAREEASKKLLLQPNLLETDWTKNCEEKGLNIGEVVGEKVWERELP